MPTIVPPPALPAMLLLASSAVFAADSIPFRASVDLRSALEGTVGITWSEAPLRSALNGLARGQSFAFQVDRRIDPDQKVEFIAKDERLEVALAKLAAKQNAGTAVVGPVVYLGPKSVAECLPTVAALKRWEVQQAGAAAKFAAAKEIAWEEFADPRVLVAETAKAYGVKVANPELLPHDLWAANRWPATNFADRMTLLLVGFDLSFRMTNAQTLELVPFPRTKDYAAVHSYRGDPAKAIAAVQKLFPDLKPQREGTNLTVMAPFEVQEKIARLLQGEKVRVTTAVAPTKHYSLKVEGQPAGAVAKTVAADLGKELKFAPEVREKLQQRVSFTVKDGTLEELLAAALSPLRLTWKVDDTSLEVFAEP